jgi:hypothetical protein
MSRKRSMRRASYSTSLSFSETLPGARSRSWESMEWCFSAFLVLSLPVERDGSGGFKYARERSDGRWIGPATCGCGRQPAARRAGYLWALACAVGGQPLLIAIASRSALAIFVHMSHCHGHSRLLVAFLAMKQKRADDFWATN